MKVMIDIETLSTEHNAVVLSIGAVKFTEERVTEDTFYVELDQDVQTDELNRDVSESNPPNGTVRPAVALRDLIKFCADDGVEEFWFRGPTFDAVILENLASQCHLPVPWKFWQIRDARTFDSLQMPRHDKKKVSHNALEDAIEQAKDVVHVFTDIRYFETLVHP